MNMSIVEQHYQNLQHLDIAAKKALVAKLTADIAQKPLNDLSKFTPRNDLVIGNSDDLVNISWEGELNLDFPK